MKGILASILAAAALVGAAWLYGHHVGAADVQAKWDASKAAEARALAGVQASASQITTKVVTQYVDRIKVVRARTATIVKQVPIYVSEKADAACTVPAGFVRVHDAAAAGAELSGPASGPFDAPSGVALSTVASTVAGNYSICAETAERLKALQDWARQQADLTTHARDPP